MLIMRVALNCVLGLAKIALPLLKISINIYKKYTIFFMFHFCTMHQMCIESAVRSYIRTYFKKCVSPIGCSSALHYLEGLESGFEFSLDNVSYRVGHNVSALYTSSPTRIDHGVYRYSVYYQGCYGDERAATPPTPKRRILIWRHQQKRRPRERKKESISPLSLSPSCCCCCWEEKKILARAAAAKIAVF